MKKVVSILLCAVMLFSFACVFAFAEDAAPAETVTITFYDEDGRTVLDTVVVEKGKNPVGPPAPVKPRQDGDPEWEFSGWLGEDGKTYYSGTLPVANSDMTFTATYKKIHDNEAEGNITIMSFIASIFERLNKIFAQLSTYYNEIEASVKKLLG